jgi:hypothetical protein
MMPQREENESMYEQTDTSYGRYEGDQEVSHRSDWRSEAPLPRETTAEKVYPQQQNRKNMFRLGMFMVAMVMLLLFALLFIFFLGGTGGWISFCVAAGVIFLLAVIVIDKIE